jgi:hypothetical protein
MPFALKKCVICGAEFTPSNGRQRRCDEHKNPKAKDAKKDGPDRRLGPASGRVYKSRSCDECGVEFVPAAAGTRYCPEHSGTSEWERRNVERHREGRRIYMRRRRHAEKFGDPDIYEKLVERDGERCAICKRSPGDDGVTLVIDHCHKTEAVRGLLCARCNTGLGYFQDDRDRLVEAVRYVAEAAPITVV